MIMRRRRRRRRRKTYFKARRELRSSGSLRSE